MPPRFVHRAILRHARGYARSRARAACGPSSTGWDFPEYPPDWPELSHAAKHRAGNRCEECGTQSGPLHAHHIVSLSHGGSNSLGNLRVLCESCHAGQHPHMRHLARSQSETMTDWHPLWAKGASAYEEERAKAAKAQAESAAEANRQAGFGCLIVAGLLFVLFLLSRAC